MTAPICSRPSICRSIGRAPSLHPAGFGTFACFALKRSGDRNIEDVLTIAPSSSEIVLFLMVGTVIVTSPSRLSTLPPIDSMTSRSACMSDISGTFLSVTGSEVMHAAITAFVTTFLEPEIRMVPSSTFPPSIRYFFIDFSNFFVVAKRSNLTKK